MDNKSTTLPGARLSTAASYIRNASILADIGTDHALLPIYAVKNGISAHAYATDVNREPLLRAEENIRKHGADNWVNCIHTSGFEGLDGLGITDGAICGMGGELIADIISSAGFIWSDGFRLILQPMTRHDAARRALWQAGFNITSETTVREERKYYTVICADFDGAVREYDEFSALYGDFAVKKFATDEDKRDFIGHEITKYERIIKGKSLSGLDVSFERGIIERLSEKMQEV